MRLLPTCQLLTCTPKCVGYCRPVYCRPVHLNASNADMSTVYLSTYMRLLPICKQPTYPHKSTADLSTADLSTYMPQLQICLQPTCPPKCVYCRSVFCRPVHLNVSTAELSTTHRSFNRCIPSPRPTCLQVLSSLPSIFSYLYEAYHPI